MKTAGKTLLAFLFLGVLLFTATPVSAWEFHVSDSDGFQAALTAAQSNGADDTIYLSAGIYHPEREEHRGFVYEAAEGEDQALTIKAEPGLSPHEVIIDGGGTEQGIYYLYSDPPFTAEHNHFTLEGVTIRNAGYCGLSVWSLGAGSVTVTRNVITGNSCGVDINSLGPVMLRDNIVTENTLGVRVDVNFFSEEHALVDSVVISSNVVSKNDGGGIAVTSGYNAIVIGDNLVLENAKYDGCAGIAAGTGYGTVTITHNVVSGNVSGGGGGGICAASEPRDPPPPYFLPDYGLVKLINNVVTGNVGDYGGGGVIEGNPAILTNNTITGNTAQNGHAGGVVAYLWWDKPEAYFYNNIIRGNKAEGYPETDDIYAYAGAFYMEHNDYHALYADPYGGATVQGEGNIDEDPLFAGDYHLQPQSPCIDAGTNGAQGIPDLDSDGGQRIVNEVVDIGAYEYYRDQVNLEPGDLLFTRSHFSFVPQYWTHVGMYVGGGRIVEAITEGVTLTRLASWSFPDKSCVAHARVVTADASVRDSAVSFALAQLYKPYDNPFWPLPSRKESSGDSSSWYCSELVWAAYLNASNGEIDLDSNTCFICGGGVSPSEVYYDAPDVQEVGGHRESCFRFNPLFFLGLSPVDLSLVDPDGLTVSKEVQEIPGAVYTEADFDNDGDLDDEIAVPEPKMGVYRITVIPESGAPPEDTYSVVVGDGEQVVVLAEDAPTSELPRQYVYQVAASVGGIAELPSVGGSDSSTGTYAALAGVAAGLATFTAGAWYARRRWGR